MTERRWHLLKLLGFLLAVTLVISAWAVIKRRLKPALKVIAVIYGVSFVARVLNFGIDEERAIDLILIVAAFVALWVLVWGATTLVARRRGS